MESRVIPVIHEIYRNGHLINSSWCPVTFVLVEAGFTVNWSITRKQGAMRTYWGTMLEISTKKPKHYPHRKPAPTRCGTGQHWYKGDLSCRSRPSERGAKRLLTTAFFSRIWLSLSTPFEFFSCPDLTGLSSLAPRHKDFAETWMHMNGEIGLYVTKNNSHGYAWGFPGSSFPHLIFKFRSRRFSENCPWPAGSPDESYTEIQQPHDAIFRI